MSSWRKPQYDEVTEADIRDLATAWTDHFVATGVLRPDQREWYLAGQIEAYRTLQDWEFFQLAGPPRWRPADGNSHDQEE